MFVSARDVLDVLGFGNSKMAISLYVYSSPNESDKDFRIRLNSLNDAVIREVERYGGADRNLKATSQNLEKVRNALIEIFVEEKAQTYCVFVSDQFLKIVELPMRLKERMVIDCRFYMSPLIAAIEQFHRFAVLIFDRHQAKLFNYYLGELQEENAVFHNYVLPRFNASTSSWKCLREKTINHKIEDSFHRHLKEVARLVFESFQRFGFDRLLLASHKPEIDSITRHLHSYLRARLAGEFVAEPDDNVKTIRTKTATVVAAYRAEREKARVAQLWDSRAHNRAVFGVDAVADALMAGNVREVVCSSDFHAEGFVCPQGHFLTTTAPEGRKCIFCKRNLDKRAFFEDELVEEAISQRSEVFHLFYEKEALEDYGIACFLRF